MCKYTTQMRQLIKKERKNKIKNMEENKRQSKELFDKAAFVDGFDSKDAFQKFFSNKYDTILGSLPGNMENFQEYPFIIIFTYLK